MIELWDTSALILAARDGRRHDELRDALQADDVAITDAIAIEYLNGARNAAEYDRVRLDLDALRVLPTLPDDWIRARDVHRRLASTGAGHQRSVRVIDLVIAAVAERSDLRIVHVDRDYDRIASLTGQPVRWIGPDSA